MHIHTHSEKQENQTFLRQDNQSKILNRNRRDVTHMFKSRLVNKKHINSKLKSILAILTNEVNLMAAEAVLRITESLKEPIST